MEKEEILQKARIELERIWRKEFEETRSWEKNSAKFDECLSLHGNDYIFAVNEEKKTVKLYIVGQDMGKIMEKKYNGACFLQNPIGANFLNVMNNLRYYLQRQEGKE
jgi:hypothetical protein